MMMMTLKESRGQQTNNDNKAMQKREALNKKE